MEPSLCRLFIAIPAPAVCSTLLQELRENNPDMKGIRWVPDQNLHITVFFIGVVDVIHIPAIVAVMKSTLPLSNEFELIYKGVFHEGAKPNKPSMVWIRYERHEQFTGLSNAIGKELSAFITISSRFPDPVPHITLARIHQRNYLNIPTFNLDNVKFSGFELWQSISVEGGVHYKSIAQIYR